MIRIAVASAMLTLCGCAWAAGGIGNVFGALMGRSGAMGNGSNIDEALAQVTVQINRSTPMVVDKETRLDRVSAEPGGRLSYHYTLTGLRRADVDPAAFLNAIRPQLKSRLCASQEMQVFLRNGVKVAYVYKSNDGQPVGSAQFTPGDCGYKS